MQIVSRICIFVKNKEVFMTIRVGTKQDMSAVLELIKELAAFEKEPDAVILTVADLVRDGFNENPLFDTFIAEQDSEIIGMALYYFRYSTWKGKTIHLEDLIVKEHARNSGCGSALYEAVMRKANEEGVKRVEWNVLNWNTPAIAFYEKTGATVFEDWRVAQMDAGGIVNFLDKK